MSITIHQIPQTYTPVYNDMRYTVSSDNTAQANFKYVADVYVSGVRVASEKIQPHPTTGLCYIDIKRFVSPYVTSDASIAGTDGFYRMSNSFVVCYVRFGEQYGPSSGIVTYSNLATSESCYAFAGALNELDFIDYTKTDIIASSGTVGNFMTNKPRPHYIHDQQEDWLAIAVDTDNEARVCGVVTYDFNGAVIQSAGWLNSSGSISGSDSNRFMRVPSGYNMNDITNLSTGGQPILSAGVNYYKIYTLNAGLTATSEQLTTYIKPDCNWGTAYTVHFQNAYGAFDTFRFNKWTTKNETIERQEYKKNTGTYGASSFTVSKGDRGYVSYYTKIDRLWVMRSDWLEDSQVAWLAELIESPEVYVNVDGTLIPVTIQTNNYEQITKQTNQLKALEITVKFAASDFRQLG